MVPEQAVGSEAPAAIISGLDSSRRNAAIAIGLYSVPVFARVVRSSVLKVRELEFVQAARALGG
jgi:peptide/nickel transport system permease protein